MVNVGAKLAFPGELERRRAWRVAASVVDPEVPAVTIADLGILSTSTSMPTDAWWRS